MQNIVKELKSLKEKRVLVLTHHNADLDALASAIALAEGLEQIGVKASIGVAESIAKPAQNIAKEFKIEIDPDCKDYEYVILAETSVPEQLSTVKNLRADMVIDHHPRGKLCEKAVCYIDEKAKSLSQVIYKILLELGCEVDKGLAKIIAAGIVADTAFLRLADKEVFEILLELMEKGFEFSDVLKAMEIPQEISERTAALKAARRMDLYKIGDVLVAFSNISSHEAEACRALVKIGADVAVVFAEKEDELRISSRARNTILNYNIDLSEIFKEVGKLIEGSGGGHNLAGSANGKKADINKVKKFILAAISKKLGKEYKEMR